MRARLSCLPNSVKSVRRRFPCKFEISQQWMLPSSSLDLDTLDGAPHHLAFEPSTTLYMENCKSSCDLLWNFSTYQRASPRLHALRGDLLVFLPNNKQRVSNDRNERETLLISPERERNIRTLHDISATAHLLIIVALNMAITILKRNHEWLMSPIFISSLDKRAGGATNGSFCVVSHDCRIC